MPYICHSYSLSAQRYWLREESNLIGHTPFRPDGRFFRPCVCDLHNRPSLLGSPTPTQPCYSGSRLGIEPSSWYCGPAPAVTAPDVACLHAGWPPPKTRSPKIWTMATSGLCGGTRTHTGSYVRLALNQVRIPVFRHAEILPRAPSMPGAQPR